MGAISRGPEGEGSVGYLSDQSAHPLKSTSLETGTRFKAQLHTHESNSGQVIRPPWGPVPLI